MSAIQGISVVIPNYNGVRFFTDTLAPVFDVLQKSGYPFEVIVSDDYSTDGSIAWLQQHYPAVRLIASEKNNGFSPTINKGIFAATHSHVLLLNSDVKLTPGFFNGLARYFERDDTFGVMVRIIGWDDDDIQDGGKYPSFHGLKIKTSGNYIPQQPEPGQWLYSMYLSGACALVDRNKIIGLKGFDELFAPFYVEDYELSLRAWRLGWKCYYDHATACRHKLSATIRSGSRKKAINLIYNRNKMYLHAIHLEQPKRFFWFAQLVSESLGHFITLRWTYLRSVFSFAKSYKKVIRSRERFHKVAGDRQLLKVEEVTDLVLSSLQKEKIVRL